MDYNTRYTRTLSDGTNTYVYGVGIISQTQGTSTDYFLGNALGSVRQITNDSGAITYAKSYDPYGAVTQTSGSTQTAYGYTGEYTSNDLVYLRARHYAPTKGRFFTRDPFGGNAMYPASQNAYTYTQNNPVLYTDPGGDCVDLVTGAIAGIAIIAALPVIVASPDTALDIASFAYNIAIGDYAAARWDAGSLMLPGVALGLGTTAYRFFSHADDGLRALNRLDDAYDAVRYANRLDNITDTANYGGDFARYGSTCLNSFSADTEVVTEDGDTPISLIEIGDYVLAWDESTDTLGWYEVTDTINHTDEVIVHLTIDGETLETTPEHPFYVEGKGWVEAEDLQIGDDIRKADGTTGEVESIEFEEITQEMYTLAGTA